MFIYLKFLELLIEDQESQIQKLKKKNEQLLDKIEQIDEQMKVFKEENFNLRVSNDTQRT